MQALRRGDLGDPDLVVDVQNGLPFFTRLVTRAPGRRPGAPRAPRAVAGRLSRADRAGSAGGSRAGSRRGSTGAASTSAVSPRHARRAAAARRGPRPDRRRPQRHRPGSARSQVGKTEHPSICVVGRLVPAQAGRARHRRGRRAARRAARARRAPSSAAAGGRHDLHAYAEQQRARRLRRFLGARRRGDQGAGLRASRGCWRCPSLKEGWGLVVGEAALAGTPTVAYASAGGTRESVQDGESGLLVDDRAGFVDALRRCSSTTSCARGWPRVRAPTAVSSRGSRPGPASRTWSSRRCAGRRVSTD